MDSDGGYADAIRRAARRVVLLQRAQASDGGDVDAIIELAGLAREDQQHLQSVLMQAHADMEWQLAAASLSLDLAAEQLNRLPLTDDAVNQMRCLLSQTRARFDRQWLSEQG